MSREVHAHLEMIDEYSRDIICPYCDKICTNDEGEYPATMYGSENFQEFRCDHCDSKFHVREHVSRDYDIAKGEEKQDIRDEVGSRLDESVED